MPRPSPGQGRDPRAPQGLHGGSRVAARPHEGAQHEPLAVGAQAHRRHEPVGRKLALVARRHQQVATTLALVGAGDAHVPHRSHPLIVQEPEHPRRHIQHHRAGLGVDHRDPVDRLRVTGERQAARVRVEHQEIRRPQIEITRERLLEPPDRGRHHVPQKHLTATLEIELVIQLLHRRLGREATLELQPTRKPRLHNRRRLLRSRHPPHLGRTRRCKRHALSPPSPVRPHHHIQHPLPLVAHATPQSIWPENTPGYSTGSNSPGMPGGRGEDVGAGDHVLVLLDHGFRGKVCRFVEVAFGRGPLVLLVASAGSEVTPAHTGSSGRDVPERH